MSLPPRPYLWRFVVLRPTQMGRKVFEEKVVSVEEGKEWWVVVAEQIDKLLSPCYNDR